MAGQRYGKMRMLEIPAKKQLTETVYPEQRLGLHSG